jgi:hypothetical protein
MSIELLQSFLGWCTLINVVLLLVWVLGHWLAHDWIYQFHSKLFQMSVATFDSIHYAGMAAYKIAIFMLNLVPYLALHLLQ